MAVKKTITFSAPSVIILGFILLLLVCTCATPVIFDDNEGLYAGAVREMAARHNWLVPTTDGFPRIQKPPLVYWTMLISQDLIGLNEFSMRLPNALATFGWILATYLIAQSIGSEQLARGTALTLISMTGVCIFTHLVQPEPFLACFTSFSLWALIRAGIAGDLCFAADNPHPGPSRWYYVFWFFLALGTLSKGLHGALWPLGTVILTAILRPSARRWLVPVFWGRSALMGLLLFFIIVAPWYVYMTMKYDGFLSAHFLNEQVGASLNTRYPPDAHPLPVWQFYLQHLIFWLPWTPFIPALALVYARIRAQPAPVFPRLTSATIGPDNDVILLMVWVAFIMGTVVFSTRQDYYALCSWGEVAMAFGIMWSFQYEPSKNRLIFYFLLVPCVGLTLVGVGGAALALEAAQFIPTGGASTAPIGARDTFADAIAGISPDLWLKCLPLLKLFSVAFLIGGVISSFLMIRGRRHVALGVYASTMAAPFILSTIAFGYLQAYFSLSDAAKTLNKLEIFQPDLEVACEGPPNTGSSLYYYLNGPVINTPNAFLTWATTDTGIRRELSRNGAARTRFTSSLTRKSLPSGPRF